MEHFKNGCKFQEQAHEIQMQKDIQKQSLLASSNVITDTEATIFLTIRTYIEPYAKGQRR